MILEQKQEDSLDVDIIINIHTALGAVHKRSPYEEGQGLWTV